MQVLEKINLVIKNSRGQGYDGDSNISSEAVGVQKGTKTMCEKAVCTHCCGHNLNLVITIACKIPIICLTHFLPMVPFYTFWKHQETCVKGE